MQSACASGLNCSLYAYPNSQFNLSISNTSTPLIGNAPDAAAQLPVCGALPHQLLSGGGRVQGQLGAWRELAAWVVLFGGEVGVCWALEWEGWESAWRLWAGDVCVLLPAFARN